MINIRLEPKTPPQAFPSTHCYMQTKRNSDSPFAVAEVGIRESFVEGLLVRLKVQDSDQCFLLQTARAVLGPGDWGMGRQKGEMTRKSFQITTTEQEQLLAR